jgi:hypothetical protein
MAARIVLNSMASSVTTNLQFLKRPPRPPRPFASAGTSIVEVMVAMAVVVIFLSGIHLMNSRVWGMLGSGLNSIAATRALNGRAEQLRASTWNQVTDAAFLVGGGTNPPSVLGLAGDSAGDLGSITETIAVTDYLTGTAPPFQVTRYSDGTVTATPTDGSPTMAAQPSAQVDLTVTWKAKGGASHSRQLRMIFTNGGLTGRK